MKLTLVMSILLTGMLSTPLSMLEAKKNKNHSYKKNITQEKDVDKEIYAWLRTVSEISAALRQRPFRNINFQECFQEGLKAMVSAAGAHDAFFTPESYKSVLESATGEFSGIGVSTMSKAPQDDSLAVVEVLEGYPAEKAGVQAKDKIVEIDGVKLKGLSSDEVITKIKGKRGTKVKLKIVRDDKSPMEFIVTRDTIKDQSSLGFYFPEHAVAYLSLKIFAENSAEQMSKFIKKAQEKKCNGLIIDLRRNPGGVIEAAVDVAGLFIDKGSPVVITKNKERKIVKTYCTTSDPIFKSSIPIFLLIDNMSASASEIFAGCMRHYSETAAKNADPVKKNNAQLMTFLVGTQTFGKGSVQDVFPIGSGCALKLTTMLYYLPNDTSIQACGIDPDFHIKPKTVPEKELKWMKELYGKEVSLKGHITRQEVENKTLTQQPEDEKVEENEDEEDEDNVPLGKSKKSLKQRHKDALIKDVQVQACINLIQLYDFAKKTQPHLVENRLKAEDFLKKHFVTDDKFKVEELKE